MCRDFTKRVPGDACPICAEPLRYNAGVGPSSKKPGRKPHLECERCMHEDHDIDQDYINLQMDRENNIIWGTHDEF